MQTFLPMIGFSASAAQLDLARLGKQRVEVLQIMRALRDGDGAPYSRHPASLAWVGYEPALGIYGMMACNEYRRRGYNDTVFWKIRDEIERLPSAAYVRPPWLGDLDFHRSHRSNLIRKNAANYGPKYPNTPELMPYLWPRPDDEDDRGYKLWISKAEMKRLEAGEVVLPDWLRVLTSREVVEA